MEMVKQLTLRSRASGGIMQTEFTPRLPSPAFVLPARPSNRPTKSRARVVLLLRPSLAVLRVPHILFIPYAEASH